MKDEETMMDSSGKDGGGVEEQLMPSSTNDGLAKKRTKTVKKAGKIVKKKLVKKKVKKSGSTDRIIKYAALFLLVAQMVGLVLLMRYSRTHREPNQPLYLSSAAVFVMECMKFVICCAVITYQSGGDLVGEMNKNVFQAPMEILKLCVPSLLYTVQNNLLYLALSYLDAATYQVCYQLKILTTALFSAILLQRKFSSMKWASLVILTVGVAIVQVSGSGDSHHHEASAADSAHRLMGLIAVLCAACTSGFAGVYFEKILKGSQTSLWIRNIQMGLPSIVIAFITIYSKDSAAVKAQGILGGFSSIVWTVVTVQAAGGLIVAVVVKYADNVLKVFATSFSIVINCIISAIWFDFHANLLFVVGAGLVVLASVIYSSPEGRSRTPRLPPVLPVANGTGNGANSSGAGARVM